ncbi:MAG TPA: PsiF family protein [Vicinamibacterales bacterium]|nr:PsiF family protein [Vicinamibacterales bacterium]
MSTRLKSADSVKTIRRRRSSVTTRAIAGVALAALAPFAIAQVGAPGGQGMRGHQRDSAAWQDCNKQADDHKLAAGPERQKFMRQCIESKHSASDVAKSEAARSKMGDPQSGHLHSDAPPSTAPPQGS